MRPTLAPTASSRRRKFLHVSRPSVGVTGIRRDLFPVLVWGLFFGYNVPAPVHYMTDTLYDRYII